ncbi:MAG: cell wall-binding repeat-containing protein [Lachnospiraceae bacterium]|nr:cell wall-binding repeat-containing protein [Lachnospiraceae bacterium]
MRKRSLLAGLLAAMMAMTALPVMAEPNAPRLIVNEEGKIGTTSGSSGRFGHRVSGHRPTSTVRSESVDIEETLNRLNETANNYPSAFSLDVNADNLFGQASGYFSVPSRQMVTSVKQQAPYGSCWTFGAVGSAESTGLMSDLYTDPTSPEADLSEALTLYYGAMTPEGQEPAGTEGDVAFSSDYVDNGGTWEWVISSWSKGRGLAKEAVLPYTRLINDYDTVTDELKSGTYHKARTEHLTDAHEVFFNNPARIKENLMTHGAANVSVDYDDQYIGNGQESLYKPNATYLNHTVLLVGWDDHYPRENFGHEDQAGGPIRPEHDGAWLMKNSWGSAYNAIGGYFWVSYEDSSIGLEPAVWFECVPASEENAVIYQHDGGINHANARFPHETYPVLWQSAVFTADRKTELNTATFWLYDMVNTEFEIRIYKNVTDAAVPTSGTLVAEATVHDVVPDSGYHEVELAAPVIVEAGERFSVVVGLSNDKEVMVLAETAINDRDAETGELYESAVVKAERGENALVSSETFDDVLATDWKDVRDVLSSRGNLRIKAIGHDLAPTPTPTPTPEKAEVKRLGGADRYATARKIAEEAFAGETVEEVVIVTGRSFPDALSAGGYAGYYDCPVLISNESRLNDNTKALLQSYGKNLKRVAIIGDTFSDNFYRELEALTGLTKQKDNERAENGIFKIYGSDRYETSLAVMKVLLDDPGYEPEYAIVTTGKNPADALSASAAAYRYGYPILLCRKNGLSTEARRLVVSKCFKLIILGSEENCNDELLEYFKNNRYAGNDRYETSVKFSDFCVNTLKDGIGFDYVAIAAGANANYPDALVGGMLLGRKGGQIVLVRGQNPAGNQWPTQFLTANKDNYQKNLKTFYVLGSDAAVSHDVADKLAGLLMN